MDYKEVGNSQATYLKPKNMKKGEVVEGTYNGSYEDQYEKLNFRIAQADGSTKIINGTALLANKLANVAIGTPVKIVYQGTNKLTKGRYIGKEAHNFQVLVAGEAKANAKATATDGLPF